MSSRRDFIKTSCLSCTGILLGAGALTFLESCQALPVYKTAINGSIISVPKQEILPHEKIKIIRAKNLDYDIALILEPHQKPLALLMRCTHIDNPIYASKDRFICNLHGSQFNLQGEVLQGPAAHKLNSFEVEDLDNQFQILLKK